MKNALGNKEIMARNIKHYMEAKGVNSADMCHILDVPQSTFSYWLNARTYPRIDKIEKMANYFGISKSDLVEEKKPAPEGELDSELTAYLQDLKERPEMRMLFSVTHSATKEDVEQAVKIIEALRK